MPLDGEDEPMHAFITAPTPEALKKCVDKVNGLIYLATECPEAENELKRIQLRELAALNGTLREEDVTRCKNCGNIGHRHWQCTEQKNFVNSAACSVCGGIGHLAADCKFRRDPQSIAQFQTPADQVQMNYYSF
jgi:splicing factor 1